MKWYIDMTEKEKHDFWKVIVVSVLGGDPIKIRVNDKL